MNEKYLNLYTSFLKKFLRPAKPLKIVFDCSNGTTGLILKNLFKLLNFKTFKLINSIPDGNFPGHGPNPWAGGAMNQLKKEVLCQKADLGIIFDADGDRVFFINNLGRAVEPDIIARLLIRQSQPKKVVYDIRTGWLVKNLESRISNLKIIKSRVGHYFIKKLMRETGADLGVEKSGHYYFKKFFYCDAGILTAIKIINAVSRLPYSLADFSDLLPQYYRSVEINVRADLRGPNVDLREKLKKIENYFKNQTASRLKISYLDGLTMEFNPPTGGWWFNLRSSNTEPLIRLNIEAEDQKILEKKKKELIKLLKN